MLNLMLILSEAVLLCPSLAAPSFEASVSYQVTQPMHNLFNSFGLLSVRGVYGIKLPLPTPWLKQCTKIREIDFILK